MFRAAPFETAIVPSLTNVVDQISIPPEVAAMRPWLTTLLVTTCCVSYGAPTRTPWLSPPVNEVDGLRVKVAPSATANPCPLPPLGNSTFPPVSAQEFSTKKYPLVAFPFNVRPSRIQNPPDRFPFIVTPWSRGGTTPLLPPDAA